MEKFNQGLTVGVIVYILWLIIYAIQSFLAVGTAYRKAKANGDNGVSLYGWLIVFNLAAIIPYLGYHLWKKSKN